MINSHRIGVSFVEPLVGIRWLDFFGGEGIIWFESGDLRSAQACEHAVRLRGRAGSVLVNKPSQILRQNSERGLCYPDAAQLLLADKFDQRGLTDAQGDGRFALF
jgi:hypothetical protein